jgi:hypothetical protein
MDKLNKEKAKYVGNRKKNSTNVYLPTTYNMNFEQLGAFLIEKSKFAFCNHQKMLNAC